MRAQIAVFTQPADRSVSRYPLLGLRHQIINVWFTILGWVRVSLQPSFLAQLDEVVGHLMGISMFF